MFFNIRSWGGGGTAHLTVDGIETTGVSLTTSYVLDNTTITNSQDFQDISACIYDNKVHIIGGSYNGTASKRHYIIDTENKKTVFEGSTPYEMLGSGCVSFGGKIHVFGSWFSGNMGRYSTWTESEGWVEQDAFPETDADTLRPVIYQRELYVISSTGNLYKYQSGTFVKEGEAPISGILLRAFAFKRKIHILGAYGTHDHYTWDSRNGFVKVCDVEMGFYYNPIVSDSNYIYILGNGNNENENNSILIYNGVEWENSGMEIPYAIDGGAAVHDGEKISYLIGGNTIDNTATNVRKLFKKIYTL